MKTTSIILLTCNRLAFTKKAITELYKRVSNCQKIHLIVCDDLSKDGTYEYLQKLNKQGKVHVLLNGEGGKSNGFRNICRAWNEGMKYVKSDYFITMFDDLVIPELKPDVIDQLIDLMEKHQEYGGISCRIQRIPNMYWFDNDITPARKGLAAYFRIQRKSDMIKVKGFGNRHWEEFAFKAQMEKLGKKVGWASHLWCNHLGYCEGVGYEAKSDKMNMGTYRRRQDLKRKPYPKIDPKTNMPLPGETIYR